MVRTLILCLLLSSIAFGGKPPAVPSGAPDISKVPAEMSYEYAKAWTDGMYKTLDDHTKTGFMKGADDLLADSMLLIPRNNKRLQRNLKADKLVGLTGPQFSSVLNAVLKNAKQPGAAEAFIRLFKMVSSYPLVNSGFINLDCKNEGYLDLDTCGKKAFAKEYDRWLSQHKSDRKKFLLDVLDQLDPMYTKRNLKTANPRDGFMVFGLKIAADLATTKTTTETDLDKACNRLHQSIKNDPLNGQYWDDRTNNFAALYLGLNYPTQEDLFAIKKMNRCVQQTGYAWMAEKLTAVSAQKGDSSGSSKAVAPKDFSSYLVTDQQSYLDSPKSLNVQIAQAYTEKYDPGSTGVNRDGQIETTTAALAERFDKISRDSSVEYLLKRLIPKYMPINSNQDLVQESRYLAQKLCNSLSEKSSALEPRFCEIRERIHGAPTQAEIEDTRKFVEIFKKEGATDKEEIATKLLAAMESLYGGNLGIETAVSDLKKETADGTGTDTLKEFEIKWTAFKEKYGNLSQGRKEWLDFTVQQAAGIRKPAAKGLNVKLANALLSESFTSANQIVQNIKQAGYETLAPEEKKEILETLSALFNGVFAEGLIDKVLLDESIALLDDKTTSKALNGQIKKIIETGIGIINNQLKQGQDWMSSKSSIGGKMIENIERGSLLLPLAALKQKLFVNTNFEAYIEGTTCGRVRIIEKPEDIVGVPTGMNDILVFMGGVGVPTDLGVFGALITANPQLALSHVDLKAKNRGSPGAYVGDAKDRFKDLDKKNVQITVTAGELQISAAPANGGVSKASSLENRPAIIPERNLLITNVVPLDETTLKTPRLVQAIGTKAFNYGHLDKLFTDETVRPGAAIPFSFYTNFMTSTKLDAEIQTMIQNPKMKDDSTFRDETLAKLREKIMALPMDRAALIKIRSSLIAKFGRGARIKLRSSSNSEDLPGFNGAGLYDSYAADLNDLKDLEKNIKRTWASIWNDRAYAERDVFNIRHGTLAMGILVHESYPDERANGVAMTGTTERPGKMHIELQHGENLVTNPETGDIPDVISIDATNPATPMVAFESHTSMYGGAPAMSADELNELATKLVRLQKYFKEEVYKSTDPDFKMDVEFKSVMGKDGKPVIVIKQARPGPK